MKFWDGTTLTPADVVFSLQQAASQKAGSQIAAFYTAVKSITASGDRVVVRMKQPDPYFRYAPAVTYILQKKYWQANLKDIGTPKKLTMCTGPHRFTKFQGDGTSELVAFDGYWGGRPAVRAITLKVIVNEATRLLAMRQGEIDGSFRISQDVIDQWKRLSNTRIQLAPELRTAYLSLDTAIEPWNDIHVRRAIAYSIDKPGLVRAILRGYGEPAPTLPPPEQWGDVLPQAQVKAFYRTLPKYSYNLAKAKAELQQSAFPDGFKATLPFPDSAQTDGKAALVAEPGAEEDRDRADRQGSVDRQVVRHALQPPVADGPSDRRVGRGLPGPGRCAPLHLRQQGRDEERLQHRELQERNDGPVPRPAAEIGEPEGAGGGDQAGAPACRGRPAVHTDLVPGHRNGGQHEVELPGLRDVVSVHAVGPGHLGPLAGFAVAPGPPERRAPAQFPR